jgi:hypothetical protein
MRASAGSHAASQSITVDYRLDSTGVRDFLGQVVAVY